MYTNNELLNTYEYLRTGPQPTYRVPKRLPEPSYQHKHGLLAKTKGKDKSAISITI
jgi:hypothetical protein